MNGVAFFVPESPRKNVWREQHGPIDVLKGNCCISYSVHNKVMQEEKRILVMVYVKKGSKLPGIRGLIRSGGLAPGAWRLVWRRDMREPVRCEMIKTMA